MVSAPRRPAGRERLGDAARRARRAPRRRQPFPLHLSTQIGGELWIAEPRAPVTAGERAALAGGGSATFLSPVDPSHPRLWYVMLSIAAPLDAFLARHGTPIRYRYVTDALPIGNYQTIFARVPGSAEMPSAGRPFSQRSLEDLRRAGVAVAAITLHTGVSSPERHERPYREWFDVSAQTAAAVNGTPAARRPRDRGRHDGRARAGERGHRRRGDGGERLDRPDRDAGARRRRGRRPADRIPRARGQPPRPAARVRRRRAARARLRATRSTPATSGTSSGTCTCCCDAGGRREPPMQ